MEYSSVKWLKISSLFFQLYLLPHGILGIRIKWPWYHLQVMYSHDYCLDPLSNTSRNSAVFWILTPCILVEVYLCSSKTSVDFDRTTRSYHEADSSFHRENLSSNKNYLSHFIQVKLHDSVTCYDTLNLILSWNGVCSRVSAVNHRWFRNGIIIENIRDETSEKKCWMYNTRGEATGSFERE
jgi:hypothetical protein